MFERETSFKGTVKKKWRGYNYRLKELNDTSIYLIFLSLEIDIKMCQNYTKTYICKIYVRIIWPDLPPAAVQYTSHALQTETRDNNTVLPLEGVLVTWYGRVSYIYTFWYNFDTFLCQFLETGTSDRCLTCLNQLLRFSGFSLYPIPFFL